MLKTERCTTPEALDALVDLALALWPGHSPSELTRERHCFWPKGRVRR